MVNKEEAIKLYKQGRTLQEIGTKYGVSRQRINQIISFLYNGKNYRWEHLVSCPTASEVWVRKKLLLLGHRVKYTPKGSLFDLLVDDKKRIEVKHREKVSKGIRSRLPGYRFNQVNNKRFDCLIAITGSLKKPVCYLFSSKDCPKTLFIPEKPVKKTKYQKKYREMWCLLKNLTTPQHDVYYSHMSKKIQTLPPVRKYLTVKPNVAEFIRTEAFTRMVSENQVIVDALNFYIDEQFKEKK